MAAAAPLIDEAGLLARLLAANPVARQIVGIAGPPGSGKSTVAERLVAAANAARPGYAALLLKDGYHYDDGLLEAMGRCPRKGAPDTFDVGGGLPTRSPVCARATRRSLQCRCSTALSRSPAPGRG